VIGKLAPTLEEHMAAFARELRRRAKHGLFGGVMDAEGWRYIRHCTFDDAATLTRVMFTRDVGHHTSGWLKNPDYERCWHLSTSPRPNLIVLPGEQLAEPDMKTCGLWVRAFYGADARLVWAESPKSDVGKQHGVWHWRLFCDERWQPILPRKEVYTREFTEAGWRSASQVLGEHQHFESETEDGRTIVSTVDPT
jgi:hypothetical protein